MGVVPANPSGARDLKVYADHLFFTGDGAGDHGLVVFDLTRLRDSGPDAVEFAPDAVYRGIASAHNLVLDPESGFAFPVGASGGGQTCGGGLHMVDVRSPKSPVFAGCFTDTEGLIYPGRTHDAQCVVYRGPDDRFPGAGALLRVQRDRAPDHRRDRQGGAGAGGHGHLSRARLRAPGLAHRRPALLLPGRRA